MPYFVKISEAAEKDLQQAFDWYTDKEPALGIRFSEKIITAVSSINAFPLKTCIRYGQVRVFFIQKFPFGIHYTVQDNGILIIAVFHTSADPNRWPRR